MSIEVMRYVWKHSKSKGNSRLMLLAIADIANDAGDAYPGVDRLSEKCNVSRRTAQECIQDLERIKELYVYENVGTRTKSGWTNLYRVHLEGIEQPPVRTPSGSLAVARAVTDKKSRSFPKGVQPAAPLNDVQPATPHDVQIVAPHDVQPAAPKSSVDTPVQPSDSNRAIESIIKAWIDGQVVPPVTNQFGNKNVRSNAKAINQAGYTPAQVTAFVKELAAMPYWTGKLIPMGYVANNIAARFAVTKTTVVHPSHVPFPAADTTPDDVPMTPEAAASFHDLMNSLTDEVTYAKSA